MRPLKKWHRCDRRSGITVMESLIAIGVTAIAGAALLTSVGAAVRSSSEMTRLAVGQGIAEQLLDEMSGARFPSSESSRPNNSNTREFFDDLDDYDGWAARPPVDRFGHPLGTEGNEVSGLLYFSRIHLMRPDADFIQRFTRSVEVESVVRDGNSGWRTSTSPTNYRRVIVRVTYTDGRGNEVPLIRLNRIFSFVEMAP